MNWQVQHHAELESGNVLFVFCVAMGELGRE